jgi:hypothetical protein
MTACKPRSRAKFGPILPGLPDYRRKVRNPGLTPAVSALQRGWRGLAGAKRSETTGLRVQGCRGIYVAQPAREGIGTCA